MFKSKAMKFRLYIRGEKGKPKPGAISRFAEHLRVSYTTMLRWYHGIPSPSPTWQRRLDEAANARLDISRKPRTDIGKRHASKKSSCADRTQLKGLRSAERKLK